MSLRTVAKELGISPAYLSYRVNGKRPWRPDLYERYCELVNTSVNSQPDGVNSAVLTPCDDGFSGKEMERKMGFEPTTLSLARRCSTTEPLPLTAPAGNLPWCRGSELNRRHVDFQSTALPLSYLGP